MTTRTGQVSTTSAAVRDSSEDYEGGTTEDELNEAVGVPNYQSRCCDSFSSNSGQGTRQSVDRSQIFVTTFITDSISDHNRTPVS